MRVTSTAVAMLARAVDARWGGRATLLRVRSTVEPAWLRLESGRVQGAFNSGVRVVLEGLALQHRSTLRRYASEHRKAANS